MLDLRDHDQAWVRSRFGDRHLGFPNARLERLLRAAGLREVRVQVGAKKTGDPFVVLIASGVKQAPGSGLRAPDPARDERKTPAARAMPEACSPKSGA